MPPDFMEEALSETVIALERQRQHGTMIPDQTGFTAAYDTIMNAVPEAHKSEAGMDILQAIWMHDNNNNQGVPTFDDWIERNYLQGVFFMNEVGQEHRYEQVVRDLRAKEAKRHDALVEFQTYTEGELRIYGQMTPEAVEFSEKHVTSVKRVKEARDKGEKHFKMTQETYERGVFLSRGGDINSRGIDVPWFFTYLPRNMLPEMQVQVHNQLRSMSYYCGRRAGTYIFRFGNPLRIDNLQSLANGEAAATDTGGESSHSSDEALPGGNTVDSEQRTFTYCGLVPRNRADHVARLEAIRGRVLHILVATCSYIAGHTGVSSEQSVAEMHARMGQATDQDLETISRYGRIYFEQGYMVQDITEAFRRSSVLTEFVYLMGMYDVTSEEIKEGKRLVELICRVANLTEADMVGQENMRLESTAWDCLLMSYDTGNCFVFHDDEVERLTGVPLNIHDYYSREEFVIDPNHPKAQYLITDEVWKKLESDYLFTRSLHQRWIREHPRASRLADLNTPKQDFPLLASAFLRGPAPDPLPTTDDPQPLPSQPATESAQEQPPPVKRGRGRPKGSKNKPKPPGWVPKPRASGAKRKRRNESPSNSS
ncbi:hypothetical protein MY11210_007346 [Beauveria gryllotalpidicola]